MDPDRYIDSINALDATADCPSCGRFAWGPATEYMFVPSAPEAGELEAGRGYPVFALICDHCGFVRMHFTPVLEREQPPPNDPIDTGEH
jgi:hypothetical protein